MIDLSPIKGGLLAVALALASSAATFAQSSTPPRIDIARAPAPLFDDPVFHGATDCFVIWNPQQRLWFMYYTQRRATLPNPNGVDWVHGSAIGIATSKDGLDWKYLGTCEGDHDLSAPLKATTGLGPKPGVTWWAPTFIYEDKTLHMFVTFVDGIYTNWKGRRTIMHFTSEDGVKFRYVNTCALNSDRVIDPTVYKIGGTFYMVYKDEKDGSHSYRSESKDLIAWSNPERVGEGHQEAPFVFQWKGSYWMIVDVLGDGGLRIYQSPNGKDQWTVNNTVLMAPDGLRTKDDNVGHHPDIVVQTAPDGTEQCLVFYFTHQDKQTVIQVAELELGADGKVVANRNKYAAAPKK